MGLVVYVTIGDLSRMPGFAAAGDVDYESVGKYGEGIKIIQGKSKHNKKRFPIPGAFLQHVFGDLIPLIC